MYRSFGVSRKVKGFTLIELLVVVAIIALLISILLPSLSRAREQGRRVVCAASLRSISQGAALYLEDTGYYANPTYYPEQLGDSGEFTYYGPTGPVKLKGTKMIPAGEESTLWDCGNAVKQRLSWKDPARQTNHNRYAFLSYGTNDWGLGENGFSTAEPNPPEGETRTGMLEYRAGCDDWWGVRESEVAVPSDFICFLESNRDGMWDQLAAQDQWDWCWENGERPGAAHPMNGVWGVNVAYFDGHVVWEATYKSADIAMAPASDRMAHFNVVGIMNSDRVRRFCTDADWQVERMKWSRDHKIHEEIDD